MSKVDSSRAGGPFSIHDNFFGAFGSVSYTVPYLTYPFHYIITVEEIVRYLSM